MRSLIATATTTALLATGCTADRPWPKHPVAVTAGPAAVGTIDVLPFDLQMWSEPAFGGDLAAVRSGAELNVMNAALDALAKRNYAVGAMIDWDGNFAGGTALTRDDLLATVGSLGHYGAAAVEHPGQLPVPFLPARLGESTGADATLYVGGWSYVAAPHTSTGEKIAEGIVIGVLIIGVVALIAAVTSSGSKKSSRGHRSSDGGAVALPSRGGHSGGTPVGRGHFTAARGVEHVHRSYRGPGPAAEVLDAFGRTAIDIALSTPDWGEDPDLPASGSQSQMYLEMTLVDNHNGLALWHAHQLFPASAASASDTARVARTMLAQLPMRAQIASNDGANHLQ